MRFPKSSDYQFVGHRLNSGSTRGIPLNLGANSLIIGDDYWSRSWASAGHPLVLPEDGNRIMPRRREGRGGKSPTKTAGSHASGGTNPPSDPLRGSDPIPAEKDWVRELLDSTKWPDSGAFRYKAVGQTAIRRGKFLGRDDRIEIGGAIYPSRAPIAGEFVSLGRGGVVVFLAEGCGPLFVGKGESEEAAYQDWADQIHCALQALFHKQEFELSEDEAAKWAVLSRLIDVDAYKSRVPIVVNETGWILEMRSGMRDVAWWPSEERETITLDRMPVEFAGYGPNQWFDAVVERDRLSWGMLKARHVQAIDPIPPMSDEDVDAFLAGTRTLADLPEAPDDEDEP